MDLFLWTNLMDLGDLIDLNDLIGLTGSIGCAVWIDLADVFFGCIFRIWLIRLF